MKDCLFLMLFLCFIFPVHAADTSSGNKAGVARVSIQPLRDLVIFTERDAPATAISRNESRISAQVSAVVEQIPVQVGEVVKQGTILVMLDPRDYELAVNRAEASLKSVAARIKLADFQLQRARELYKKNFASEDTLTQRETELSVLQAEQASARAQLESARRDLEKCTIHAPFDAIVHQRLGNIGELAAPGTPLLNLIDMSQIEVTARLQPKDGDSLQTAKKIAFVTRGKSFPVSLLRISPAIDREARTREVRLRFVEHPAAPGTQGRIVWHAEEPLLPADLLSRRGGKLGVLVAEDHVVRFMELDEAQEGRPVAVQLPLDTRVIVEGRFAVQDGQQISILP